MKTATAPTSLVGWRSCGVNAMPGFVVQTNEADVIYLHATQST